MPKQMPFICMLKNLLTNSGESNKTWGLLANFGKDTGLAVFRDVVCDLESPKCSTTFSMNNALGNPFTIKVSHRVEKKGILEQDWATVANSLCRSTCFHRASKTCCGTKRVLVNRRNTYTCTSVVQKISIAPFPRGN